MEHFKKITDYPDAADIKFPLNGKDDEEGKRQYEEAKKARALDPDARTGDIFTRPETPGDKLKQYKVPKGTAVKTYRSKAERVRIAAAMKREEEKDKKE